ncbi:MAG: OpgC family protein [Reyranellaceae bacterium]
MKPARDERLDLFRGLALIFIFVNHIPQNVVSLFTNRTWGFSDATEIFVFVSGYAAALAYGRIAAREGLLRAALHVLGRVWQLYVAHILLFVAFVAQIAWLAMKAGNPMLAEEMAIIEFMNDPVVVLIEALQLKFRPVNMDVLPLYIVLLLALPPMLWLLRRRPLWLLAGSAALYALVQFTGVNLPAYPVGAHWFFNPMAWQFLFVLGALAAARPDWNVPPSRAVDWLAGAYLLFAFVVVMSWSFEWVAGLVPALVEAAIYPIKKTDLDPLRLLHFLALAYVALRLLALRPGLAAHPFTAPLRACGRHSLQVFCCGIFLSFTGHFVLVEFGSGLEMQVLVSAAGIGVMVALAYSRDWIRRGMRSAPAMREVERQDRSASAAERVRRSA